MGSRVSPSDCRFIGESVAPDSYVKLRPGVRKLLSESREIADLAIFSAAR